MIVLLQPSVYRVERGWFRCVWCAQHQRHTHNDARPESAERASVGYSCMREARSWDLTRAVNIIKPNQPTYYIHARRPHKCPAKLARSGARHTAASGTARTLPCQAVPERAATGGVVALELHIAG